MPADFHSPIVSDLLADSRVRVGERLRLLLHLLLHLLLLLL
jgi:hypothetical protein